MGHREGYRWRKGVWRPSPAQVRVLDGVAAGLTNAEIAVRIDASPETVKWHISTLLDEAGCADRQELAAWWHSRRQGHSAYLPFLGLIARLPRAGLVITAVALASLGIALAARHGTGAISSLASGTAATQSLASQPSASAVAEPATATMSPRRRLIGTLEQVTGAVLVVDIGGSEPARAIVSPDTKIVLVSIEQGAAGAQPGDIMRWGRGSYLIANDTWIPWDPLAYETTAPVVLLPESLLGVRSSFTDAERCRWEGMVRAREGNRLHLATFGCGEQTVTVDPEAWLTRQQPLTAGELPLGITVNVYGETMVDGTIAAQTVVATEQR